MQTLPENIQGIKIDMYPETINGVYYHYSHCLQMHLGDCQRIAHGHRSALKIYINSIRDNALEHAWAKRWKDIYISNKDYIIDRFNCNNIEQTRFGYKAQQGYLKLIVPEKQCYIISSESTIELLSKYIFDTLSEVIPDSKIEVIAYEGINKGVITCTENLTITA